MTRDTVGVGRAEALQNIPADVMRFSIRKEIHVFEQTCQFMVVIDQIPSLHIVNDVVVDAKKKYSGSFLIHAPFF